MLDAALVREEGAEVVGVGEVADPGFEVECAVQKGGGCGDGRDPTHPTRGGGGEVKVGTVEVDVS